MRLVFMGTPDFSVPILDALVDAGTKSFVSIANLHVLQGVVKGPPNPVHKRAEELGLSVRHPLNFKDARTNKRFLI